MNMQSISQSAPTAVTNGGKKIPENSVNLDFMRQALIMGEKGLQHSETPVGCVLVLENEVVARGMNDNNRTGNPTRHAEFIALAHMLQTYPRTALQSTDLYVTVEPCVMCASALKQYRIRTIYFGCANYRFGGIGSVLSLHSEPSIDPSFPVYGGLFEAEAIDLMRRFYALGNKKAPISKVRNKKLRALREQTNTAITEIAETIETTDRPGGTNEEDEAELVSPFHPPPPLT